MTRPVSDSSGFREVAALTGRIPAWLKELLSRDSRKSLSDKDLAQLVEGYRRAAILTMVEALQAAKLDVETAMQSDQMRKAMRANWRCETCGDGFRLLDAFSESDLSVACPGCGAPLFDLEMELHQRRTIVALRP